MVMMFVVVAVMEAMGTRKRGRRMRRRIKMIMHF